MNGHLMLFLSMVLFEFVLPETNTTQLHRSRLFNLKKTFSSEIKVFEDVICSTYNHKYDTDNSNCYSDYDCCWIFVVGHLHEWIDFIGKFNNATRNKDYDNYLQYNIGFDEPFFVLLNSLVNIKISIFDDKRIETTYRGNAIKGQ